MAHEYEGCSCCDEVSKLRGFLEKRGLCTNCGNTRREFINVTFRDKYCDCDTCKSSSKREGE